MDIRFQDISRELIVEIDNNNIITYISTNCYNILGYNQEELIGSNFYQYVINFKDNILKDDGNFELKIQDKEGHNRWFDAFFTQSNNGGVKMSLIDISKYKEIEESEKRFRTILENTDDVIYMYQVKPEQNYIYLNSAMEREIGYTLDDFYNDPILPFHIVHPEDLHVQYKKITGSAGYEKPFQARFRHKDGHYFWCEDRVIPFYNDQGEIETIIGISRNIQEIKELEAQLEKLSFYDSLTRLFNRNYYETHEEKLNTTDDRPIGIIVCDLDNLKLINDSFGHTYGDKVLINFANLLINLFDTETVARFGRDEFVILIENTTEELVKNTFLKLQEIINEYNKSNQTLPIELSMGWAFSPSSIGAMTQTFRIADKMMYVNKSNKKKHQQIFE